MRQLWTPPIWPRADSSRGCPDTSQLKPRPVRGRPAHRHSHAVCARDGRSSAIEWSHSVLFHDDDGWIFVLAPDAQGVRVEDGLSGEMSVVLESATAARVTFTPALICQNLRYANGCTHFCQEQQILLRFLANSPVWHKQTLHSLHTKSNISLQPVCFYQPIYVTVTIPSHRLSLDWLLTTLEFHQLFLITTLL
jgi:hypothetical protein